MGPDGTSAPVNAFRRCARARGEHASGLCHSRYLATLRARAAHIVLFRTISPFAKRRLKPVNRLVSTCRSFSVAWTNGASALR